MYIIGFVILFFKMSQMAVAIGAGTLDLPFVQIHPTGLVDPNEPEAKVNFFLICYRDFVFALLLSCHPSSTEKSHFCRSFCRSQHTQVKWLAAEALRGSGAILIDGRGQRICNELGQRDYVSGAMLRGTPPYRLLLNSKQAKEFEWCGESGSICRTALPPVTTLNSCLVLLDLAGTVTIMWAAAS